MNKENREKIINYLEEIKNIGESYEECLNDYDNPIEPDIFIIAENVRKIEKLLNTYTDEKGNVIIDLRKEIK